MSERRDGGARVEAVVQICAATLHYTAGDWVDLALAALDHAGMNLGEQERLAQDLEHLRGSP